MSWLLEELTREPERPERETGGTRTDGQIPVGYRTRMFVERGALIGAQRTEAVRATRNLLGAGLDEDEAAEAIWRGLRASPWDQANPWTYEDAVAIVRDLASKPAPPPPPFESMEVILDGRQADPAPIGLTVIEKDGDVYRAEFPGHDVVIEISRVVATARATLGWVRVLDGGAELCAVEAELRSAQGVLLAWRFFEPWGPKPWREMLEQARRIVLAERRTAGVPVRMDAVQLSERPRLRISPVIVNAALNIVFAAGGSGKSMLLGLWALLVQAGRMHAGMTVEPGNVLYLDWEQDAEESKMTLDALAAGIGVEAAPRHLYMRCVGPLVDIAEDIGRLIVEYDIAVVMIDSLTFALGGDKNDSQSVMAGLGAMRRWRAGLTVIALDHVSKADRKSAGGTTIGSIMVENTAWNLLRVLAWMDTEEHVLHQVLKQTKQNKGVIGDFGLKYTFYPTSMDPEVIFVEREDPPFDVEAKMKEEGTPGVLDATAPQRQAVHDYVRLHPDRMWSRSALTEALNLHKETVRKALDRLVVDGKLGVQKGSGNVPHLYFTRDSGGV